jgi:hypothetical protein
MSFVDGMLMEDMKFLCKWRTIVFYGAGKWKFLALGWLVKIHMEWGWGLCVVSCNATTRTYTQHISYFFQYYSYSCLLCIVFLPLLS